MAIPPQFLKHVKGKEKEGKDEPGDSKAEDAAEKKGNPFAKKGSDKPNPFAKKSGKGKGKDSSDKKKEFLKDKVKKGGF